MPHSKGGRRSIERDPKRKDIMFWSFMVVSMVVAAVLYVISTGRDTVPSDYTSTYEVDDTSLAAPMPVGVIGDSYTSGTGVGGLGNLNWTARVATRFYHQRTPWAMSIGASAGSGYVHRNNNGPIFIEQVPVAVKPDTKLVVIFGSRNDDVEPIDSVRTAAQQLYSAVRSTAPDARLVVIGPAWVNEQVPPKIRAIRDVLADEAASAGATFVDPIADGWFFGDKASLIGHDKVHPTDQGHAYLEETIFPKLEPVVAEIVPATDGQ